MVTSIVQLFLTETFDAFFSKRLDGQVIVITGGNTGLGYWAALELARRGPQAIILACRNVVAGSEAAKKISAATGHKNVT